VPRADSQSCQTVTFVTHKIFANRPDISAGRKVPFVVDRCRKSLFPNGSRHSAPFRPLAQPRTTGDARARERERERGGGERERKKQERSERARRIQSAFNIDSNPISRDFHFCDLLLTPTAPALSAAKGAVFFRGSTPMRIDVASSSIKFSSDKLPISLMISPVQLPILATRGVATSRMQCAGTFAGKRQLFGYSYQLRRVNEPDGIA